MMFELYWDDLTEDAKQRVLDAFGENLNWDSFPIVQIPLDQAEEA